MYEVLNFDKEFNFNSFYTYLRDMLRSLKTNKINLRDYDEGYDLATVISVGYRDIDVILSFFKGDTYIRIHNEDGFCSVTVKGSVSLYGNNAIQIPSGAIPFESLDEKYRDEIKRTLGVLQMSLGNSEVE